MKTPFLLAFFLFTGLGLYSQDTIKMHNGETIAAKVLEVNQSTVRYKKASNMDGPDYVLGKSDIASVRYLNGEVDIFPTISSSIVIYNNGSVQTFSTSTWSSTNGQNSVFTTTINAGLNNGNTNTNYSNSNTNNNCNTVTGGDLIFGLLDLILNTPGSNTKCTKSYRSPTWCNTCHCKHR